MLYLAVINRAEETPIASAVTLNKWTGSSSPMRAFELNGKDRDAANPFGRADNVTIREIPSPQSGPTYTFPPHSITVLEFTK